MRRHSRDTLTGVVDAGPDRGTTRATRTAQALNSAVPDFGSETSIVSRLVATSSGKCSVMKTMPARSALSILRRRFDLAAPRFDPHEVAVIDAKARGVLGGDVQRLADMQRRVVAAVCTPVLYDSSRRPVVSRNG